jgi:hypothetical protein
MMSAWVRVFGVAQHQGVEVGITLLGGETVHVVVTSIGSDFVAGEISPQRSAALVIPFSSIISVTGVGDPGPGEVQNHPSAGFHAMLDNLMRLGKAVVLHTAHQRWAGVLVGVQPDFVELAPMSGPRRMVSVAGIVWVAVHQGVGVDNA